MDGPEDTVIHVFTSIRYFIRDNKIPFEITRLLGDNLTTAFEGFFLDSCGQSHHAVMKIFSDKSNPTNEANIYRYLQETGFTHTPKLYYSRKHSYNARVYIDYGIPIPRYSASNHLTDDRCIEYPYEVIIYQFLEGIPIVLPSEIQLPLRNPSMSLKERRRIYSDILHQIQALEKLNIVHGNIKLKNIIRQIRADECIGGEVMCTTARNKTPEIKDRRYFLIDYGSAIGIDKLRGVFPPNYYVIENQNGISTVEGDIRNLHHILRID